MAKINPNFAAEIKKYGADSFEACFNCGTCTATCNLTEKNANFPRKFIREGILGQTDEILASKELWLCYACGECSTHCPRQAAPGEYMAALRRYAIASYEPSGITKLLFKNSWFSILITLLLAVILGFFLFTIKPDMVVSRWIFQYFSYEVIHTLGLIIFSFTGITGVIGILKMIMKFKKMEVKDPKAKKETLLNVFKKIGEEVATMKRSRSCDEDDTFWKTKPKWQQPWLIHWSIMWGFIGLLLATSLDFMFKDPATTIWLPSRILGTVAGLLMMYGASMSIYYRSIKITDTYKNTNLVDWMFLGFLWIAGFTGFWLEVTVGITSGFIVNDIVFILHTIISMELVILFAFSKFAHAIYRPLALFFYYSKKA